MIAAIFAYGIYYVNDYYHADNTAISYIGGNDDVKVINTSTGMLLDGHGNDTALIFYPGAKVEYTSYLPMLTNLASRGIDCYLVKMPFNLAILGSNSADEIIKANNYSHYFLAGHSLGGAMASSYIHNTNKTDGLILLAAYPTEEIDKPVLSIYGSEDKVLNLKSYNDAKPLIKANFTEHIINGGNHAQFGNYGLQKGDGNAGINSTLQQNETASEIINFINKLF